jgi:motility quorum-sensing regulator / GCU-specific mRNA interferase toxin
MEKPTPHYVLRNIQKVVGDISRKVFTRTAAKGGSQLGLTEMEMRQVILNLGHENFHKSMTTYSDYRYWQDVYYSRTLNGDDVYIKLTLYEDGRPVVISFKAP